MDLNPINWNLNQYKAAGKHVVSYAAGAVSIALAFKFLTPADASQITTSISTISDGFVKMAEGVTALIAVLAPFYTAFKAANNASPQSQGASLAATATAAPSQKTTDAKVALLSAVATVEEKSPDVTLQGKIITSPEVAGLVPSNKVVSQ